MNFQESDFPIWDPTFNVLDSTKLSTYNKCPREFFFSYILGWRTTDTNIHLGFGSAFHEAMEVLMKAQDGETVGYPFPVISEAVKTFNSSWDKVFNIQSSRETALAQLLGKEPSGPPNKSRDNGLEAIAEYATQYNQDNFTTDFVEVSGSIPINEDTKDAPGDRIYFKMDALLRDEENNPGCWDHKTASRKNRSYEQDWPLKLQVGTYNYVTYTLFGESTFGVVINGAILRKPTKTGKANNEFIRINAKIQERQLSLWLYRVNEIVDRLKWDMQQLSKVRASDEVMRAFPTNDSACTLCYGCPFHGFCSSESWANPISRLDSLPMGYKREYWDPRDRGRDLETGVKRRDAKTNLSEITEGGIEATGVEV